MYIVFFKYFQNDLNLNIKLRLKHSICHNCEFIFNTKNVGQCLFVAFFTLHYCLTAWI